MRYCSVYFSVDVVPLLLIFCSVDELNSWFNLLQVWLSTSVFFTCLLYCYTVCCEVVVRVVFCFLLDGLYFDVCYRWVEPWVLQGHGTDNRTERGRSSYTTGVWQWLEWCWESWDPDNNQWARARWVESSLFPFIFVSRGVPRAHIILELAGSPWPFSMTS